MPKFLAVDQYQPSNYSLDDFMRYQALVNPTFRLSSNISSSSAPSKKTPTITALHTLFNKLVVQIRALQHLTSNSYLADYLSKIDGFQKDNNFTHLDEYLDSVNFGGYDPIFINLHNSLKTTVNLINQIEQGVERDPDELGPVAKSLEYLDVEWYRLTGKSIQHDALIYAVRSQGTPKGIINQLHAHPNATDDIVGAHIANLQMVCNLGYAEACRKEFLEGAPGVVAKVKTPIVDETLLDLNNSSGQPASSDNSSHQAPVSPIRAGLLLRIYRNPRFSDWLTQLILLSIVIAAAMATTLVTLPTLLPVAMATLVKGLSTLATRTILGAAITVGVLATATLATSLHARFFYHPRETSSGAQPQSSNTVVKP